MSALSTTEYIISLSSNQLTYTAMVLVCILMALGGHETDLRFDIMSLRLSSANRCLGAFCKRFGMQVLAYETWNMTDITRYMLLAHFMSGSTDPVRCPLAAVGEHVLEWLVFMCHMLERRLLIQVHCRRWWTLGGPLRERRIEIIEDYAVDITSCHAKAINFCRHMSSIAWHVLLVEIHLALPRAQ